MKGNFHVPFLEEGERVIALPYSTLKLKRRSNGMKLKVKDYTEGQSMKKLLLYCILIVGIVFIAGCIGEEKTDADTPASHQNNQESDDQTTDSILRPSDVPGLTLDPNCRFWAVPKNTLYVSNDESNRETYGANLPIGYRNVGENSQWMDQSGRCVGITLSKYDSSPSTLIRYITYLKGLSKEEYIQDSIGLWGEHGPGIDVDLGDPHIGDCSVYWKYNDTNTDIQSTRIMFVYNNNDVVVFVKGEKDKTKEEAIRIAKIIINRLD
jgi:hypothetical protein